MALTHYITTCTIFCHPSLTPNRLRAKLRVEQNPAFDKIPDERKPELDKIYNGQNLELKKSRTGQNFKLAKSRIRQNPKRTQSRKDKILNWTKCAFFEILKRVPFTNAA